MGRKIVLLSTILMLSVGFTAAQDSGLDFRTQDPIDFYSNISMNNNDIGGLSGLAGVNYQRFDNKGSDFIFVREASGSDTATHTIRYDDSPLRFYSGSGGSVMELTQSGNLDLLGNNLVNPDMITTKGSGSDVIIVRDTSKGQDLARFYEGGNVSIPSGTLGMGMNRITDLAAPKSGTDAVRLQHVASNYVNRSGDTMGGNLNMNGYNISSIGSLNNYYGNPCQSDYAMVDITNNGGLKCLNVSNMVSESFVYQSGDSMSGDLDMTGNDIRNVNRATFDSGQAMITTHDGSGNFNIKAGVDASNNIVAGSGGSHVQMSDNGDISLLSDTGTSEGGSFSTTAELEVSNKVHVKSANLDMNGNSINNYFGSPCPTGETLVDIKDSGTFACMNVTEEVSEEYVSRSGDSMTGDLVMNSNDIEQVSNINTGGTNLNVGGNIQVSGTVTATGGLKTQSGSVTSSTTMCLGDQCS